MLPPPRCLLRRDLGRRRCGILPSLGLDHDLPLFLRGLGDFAGSTKSRF